MRIDGIEVLKSVMADHFRELGRDEATDLWLVVINHLQDRSNSISWGLIKRTITALQEARDKDRPI